MALLFMDGFDLYSVSSDTVLGRWTTLSNTGSSNILTGRYSGSCLQFTSVSNLNIAKALPTTYSTLVLGVAIKTNLAASSFTCFSFYDTVGGTAQTSVCIQSDGSIVVKRGTSAGTTLGTSAAGVIASNTWAYVEAKILFTTGATGTYEVRVNGTNVVSGTSATTAASTTAIGAFDLRVTNSSLTAYWDDLYLCDTSGAANNNFLGDSRIETVFPTADTATKNFPTAVTYAGQVTASSVIAVPSNTLTLYTMTPAVSGNVSSIVFTTTNTGGSATGKIKGVVYADSSGVPGARLAVSTELVGIANASDNTLSFSSPPAVTAGSTYYFGVLTDTSLTWVSALTNGGVFSKSSQTYSTGPVDPAPSSMTSSTNNYKMWAVITSASANFACVKETAGDADASYIQATAASTEDLYSHAALSSTPASVAAVQLVSLVRKSDAGPRTVTNQLKSSSTDQAGTTWYPGGSYQYFSDIYPTDPATSAAWTGSGVNSATYGVKIVT